MRARYYDPETGTFLSKDPMGVSAGLNSYQYVSDNPANNTDPWGLFGWWDYVAQTGSLIGGGATAVAGGAAVVAGGATAETGVGVGVAVGGYYLAAQGSSFVSSAVNLGYMIMHPNATAVPLNSSGLGGLIVSGAANLSGVQNPAQITSINPDGSISGWGIANGIASGVDVFTTFRVGQALPALNNAAQIDAALPGLRDTGLTAITPISSNPSSALYVNTQLAGFGGAWDSIAAVTTGIGFDDTINSIFGLQNRRVNLLVHNHRATLLSRFSKPPHWRRAVRQSRHAGWSEPERHQRCDV